MTALADDLAWTDLDGDVLVRFLATGRTLRLTGAAADAVRALDAGCVVENLPADLLSAGVVRPD